MRSRSSFEVSRSAGAAPPPVFFDSDSSATIDGGFINLRSVVRVHPSPLVGLVSLLPRDTSFVSRGTLSQKKQLDSGPLCCSIKFSPARLDGVRNSHEASSGLRAARWPSTSDRSDRCIAGESLGHASTMRSRSVFASVFVFLMDYNCDGTQLWLATEQCWM